ncbi:hypothetical protein PILCRDRAFT_236443 [Piloderma croceum F 1598]|uniref:CSC1/OSCA1-like 7TM region domain-containing protein n=1 Tax=Piloderma croceum (strain F 1598) TaxID=765440 RepID=A0A0C3GDK2_PILCF|nr:hypothetical protein PILCRDRAFT_236443 [Piloderma croceum F 1598]
MMRLFIFEVVHSFLIITISFAALPGLINDPSQIPLLLVQNLLAASTFFLIYILLQRLSGTAGGFWRLVTLILLGKHPEINLWTQVWHTNCRLGYIVPIHHAFSGHWFVDEFLFFIMIFWF